VGHLHSKIVIFIPILSQFHKCLLIDDTRIFELYSFEIVKDFGYLIVVEGGKKCAPAVTRRKNIGRMTVRPISFQRE
jgi:hypothetical protein